ncbi:VOC family protein [Streptomyces sp. NPDC008125]
MDTAEHEAVGLGATKEHHQPTPERSRVLREPAGHPFCLRA